MISGVSSSSAVLAYIPSPPQGVWYVGPLALRAYALFIIIGIVVAIVWGDRRWVARGGTKGTVLDVAVWAVPFGLLGGRLYHVATDWSTYFGPGGDPVRALKVWEGGLGIWGAVLLGGVGAWIACRRRGVPLPAFGDAVGPPILLAQAIGRIGNYFNQELYGRDTTRPWGLEIYERVNDAGRIDQLTGVSTGVLEKIVHPTFLYELLWSLAVVVLLVVVDRRFAIGHGRLFALYVAGYCAGRFWVELLRDDYATHIAGIRINSFTSAIVFVLAVLYFVLATKGREDPASLASDHENADTENPENGDTAGKDDTSAVVDVDAKDADAKDADAKDPDARDTASVTEDKPAASETAEKGTAGG